MDWPYKKIAMYNLAEYATEDILNGLRDMLRYGDEMLNVAIEEDSDFRQLDFKASIAILQKAQESYEKSREAYVASLNNISYAQYLNSWHWSCVRKKALEAAKERCQVCNTGPPETHIEVHHRTYIRRGQEEPEDVTVLCGKCHKRFHEDGKLVPEPKE